MSKDKLHIIDDLVLNTDTCVIATTDGIAPHASLRTYFADHAAMKFYFLSRNNTRTDKNIKKSPHVSMLIDKREDSLSLAIEGVYSPIKNEQTIDAIVKLYLMKHPYMKDFATHPDTELIRILGKKAVLIQGLDDRFETNFKNS